MVSEKRLIDGNKAQAVLVNMAEHLLEAGNQEMAGAVGYAAEVIGKQKTVDAVPVELFNALKNLVNGEWVDCKLVQEALGVDFATGFKMFDFSRIAEWNPAPLNGQKITTKFRLKKAVEVVHGEWSTIEDDYVGLIALQCSECNEEYWFEEELPLKGYNYCPNCGAKMRGSEE